MLDCNIALLNRISTLSLDTCTSILCSGLWDCPINANRPLDLIVALSENLMGEVNTSHNKKIVILKLILHPIPNRQH